MATDALRSLWAEPRPADPPGRGPRDWVLVAALICWSVLEAVLGENLAPLPWLSRLGDQKGAPTEPADVGRTGEWKGACYWWVTDQGQSQSESDR